MVGIPNRGAGFYLSADIDGVDGSGFSVPTSAALSITGSLGLVARIAPDSWSSGLQQGIISKSSTDDNQRSYRWGLLTDGTPVLRWSTGGANTGTATATAAHSFTPGQAAWVGVTCDTVSGNVKFWNGGTGVTPTWVQHGTTVAAAFPGSFASTSPLLLGAGFVLSGVAMREVLNGILYSAAVYNGVGANTSPVQGTKVFEVNGVFGPGNTFTSATAHTVTKLGGVGNYQVDFGRNITSCTAVATIGPSGAGSAAGEVYVADRSGNVEAVFVDTNDSAGAAANLPFRLIVVC